MKTHVDDRLRDEAARFSLRHTCDDCAHFDGARCASEWPTREHRLPIHRAIAHGAIVVFCKEFEVA